MCNRTLEPCNVKTLRTVLRGESAEMHRPTREMNTLLTAILVMKMLAII
jgi:hypothetical protein